MESLVASSFQFGPSVLAIGHSERRQLTAERIPRSHSIVRLPGLIGSTAPHHTIGSRQAAVSLLLRTAGYNCRDLPQVSFPALAQLGINSGDPQYSLISLGCLTEIVPATVHFREPEIGEFNPRRRKGTLLHLRNQ